MSESKPTKRSTLRMTLSMLLVVMALVAVFAYERWRSRAGAEAMQAVANEWGLQVERSSKRSRLFGQVDGIGVEVRHSTERTAGNVHYFTRFKVFAPDAPPGRIEAASLRQKVLSGLSDEQPIDTGDAGFDQAVRVYGPTDRMRASLDAGARAAVRAAVDAGWSLDSATWQATESSFVTDAAVLRRRLELGLAAHSATRSSSTDQASPSDVSPAANEGSERQSPAPALLTSSQTEARAWLYSGDPTKVLDAAIMLAASGEDSEAVRLSLIGALPDRQQQARAIAALAMVGGEMEAMALRAVRGEHQSAAQAAAAQIEARQ